MVMSFAFLLVAASTVALIPIMLFALNLQAQNWQWQHAALFSAMIASTDAVAVSAILKKGALLPLF
jgi:NhaP-type Na+/H+ or K+/H+ antiporter